ncbi:hypothetical protein E2C01_090447 [Portunus trituberculatus]|uniref:Uncharacterized protein n=1 Tax=Portunus trituberculatus TaxID=210409 RepID=A0A5B7JKX5_PORTR|nr:hypothetical protein [Portunus trituberculatus]
MAPRSKLTYHEKGHILRQFSGHAAMSARALADRYGVNKAVFTNILEEKRTNCTSSSDITFDFFKTTSANLEVKEEAVSSEEEVGVSLKEKDDASLAKEKWVNASLEGEEEDKEMKKEPVSLVQEEAGIPAVHEQDTKSAGQDSKLTERLKEISPNDSLAPPLTHEAFSEAPDEHSHSRQELFTALLTLQQVVEYNPMPRWFTFVFDSLLPGSSLMEDAWPGALWGRRSTVSLPPPQDILSAVLVVRWALHSDQYLPPWFTFTLSRVLQKYKNRRGHAFNGVSVCNSSFRWTWF